MSKISVALVGFGTIGAGVVQILQDEAEMIQKRTGVEVDLKYVVDKDLKTKRKIKIEKASFIDDYKTVLKDPEVDVVVELVGGTTFAYQLVEESLKAGKNVVTANKALLAERGAPLFKMALENEKVIGFEASVAGGIPIIRTVNDALSGDYIKAIYGIVNGTTNYILTKMLEEKWDFSTALKKAQELGFAEADPTLDVEGFDAAHKIAILAALAFNTTLHYDRVYVEGISNISNQDVKTAGQLGYVIKLLAIARIDANDQIELRVHPTLVHKDNQLAAVRNEFNAVLIDSEYLGSSLYYGRGAGSLPTASAVVADILDQARHLDAPEETNKFILFNDFKVKDMGDVESRYYIRFNVKDHIGVLTTISGIFADFNISISSVVQKERQKNRFVPLILTTHLALEKDIIRALDKIEGLALGEGRGVMIRIME